MANGRKDSLGDEGSWSVWARAAIASGCKVLELVGTSWCWDRAVRCGFEQEVVGARWCWWCSWVQYQGRETVNVFLAPGHKMSLPVTPQISPPNPTSYHL